MKLFCNYCQIEVPHFKALLEHVEEKHPEKLKRFIIRNRKLGQVLSSKGESAEQLCEVNDWNLEDCKAKETK